MLLKFMLCASFVNPHVPLTATEVGASPKGTCCYCNPADEKS